jgi:hypothetical protein
MLKAASIRRPGLPAELFTLASTFIFGRKGKGRV